MSVRRVLYLSPWVRPQARVYAEALRRASVDVLLVTSEQHPECADVRDYELILDPRPKTPSTWPAFARSVRTVRQFDADVVLTELVRDPRWIALAWGRPRVQLIHDDRPHDAMEFLPRWERALFDRWGARSAATVAFSRYVACAVGAAAVVPLASDLPPELVPELTPSEGRRDFVLVGRLNPYKNIDITLRAWAAHVEGAHWKGDDLVLIGDGTLPDELGPHVRWQKGSYSYRDVVAALARAKASVVHYRQATQSGVQVLAMQLGVTPIVSTEGALPEYQPEGEPPVGVDDVAGLTAAFDSLADPVEATRRGERARAHYLERYAADRVAQDLLAVLDSVAASKIGQLR
jgi:glycosyltransferase involved in cell wall biosynthesis